MVGIFCGLETDNLLGLEAVSRLWVERDTEKIGIWI